MKKNNLRLVDPAMVSAYSPKNKHPWIKVAASWFIGMFMLCLLIVLCFAMSTQAKAQGWTQKDGGPLIDYAARATDKTVVITRGLGYTIPGPAGSGTRYVTDIKRSGSFSDRGSKHHKKHHWNRDGR